MTEKRQRISDPQSVRALAHPLRLELMDVLGMESELTATQCAERTGESVASCSFHLRMLAKYGYVEPAEPRGREKPWRLASRSREIGPDHDDPASLHEVSMFAQLIVDREADRLKRWLGRASSEPQEWTEATAMSTSSMWLTAEEAQEITTAVTELHTRFADRFRDRRDDPSRRPAGARPVHLLGASSVDVAAEAES
ncbi:ArsR family transcriptional regulator [Haloactinopolyspora alba]|uniref:ArsR family transcriptional regulator n=1 Tax=Haloactinopolyspora alba TaxID=648780 RepID=A0A2P8DVJ8_9ACTN|nr:winged helix-turn-helix domain-containing protein [Haloactinopolyspora alba]PSL01197.1 ArsR family transcriptional regulator [Haloactinopolyspora alba]